MSISLFDLIAHARIVSTIAHPHTNVMLTVLAGLDEQDVELYTLNGKLGLSRISTIARRLRLEPEVVATTFDRQIPKDLQDYTSFYMTQIRRYHHSHIPDSRLSQFLERHTSDGTIPFVLHDLLQLWSAEEKALDGWFIDDPDDPDSVFPHVVRGYLISRGSAYPTTVHLLEESYTRQWLNWRALWEYY